MGGESPNAHQWISLVERVPVRVTGNFRQDMIVKPGALDAGFIEIESQGFYEVQVRSGIGAQADDISRIGWNFWFMQNDVEHAKYPDV